MSETEELNLPFEQDETPAPKKKAARKAVRRGSARKKAASAEDKADDKPQAQDSPDDASEKPQKQSAPKAKQSDDDIPETFSADPDDVDDYGDKSSRKDRKGNSRDDGDDRGSDDNDNEPRGKRSGSDDDNDSGQDSDDDRDDRGGKSGGHQQNFKNKKGKNWQPKNNKPFQKQKGGNPNNPNNQNNFQKGNKKNKFNKNQRKKGFFQPAGGFAASSDDDYEPPVYDSLEEDENLNSIEAFDKLREEKTGGSGEAISFNEINELNLPDLEKRAEELGATWDGAPSKKKLLRAIFDKATADNIPLRSRGIIELAENGYGFVVYEKEQYRVLAESAFMHKVFIDHLGLQRGHVVDVLLHAPRENETCPFVIGVEKVMDAEPDSVQHLTPFTELVPYYPLDRILLECPPDEATWDNKSMRIVDLLTPIGLGQRGLIVAPPRTGKTVLLQAMANAIVKNRPDAHLIILLIDERPEEVTDFRRQVETAEVISSTFDESAESHVHAAEMVIEKSRRMVESGQDVIILLDSITRLARAYNTLMPSSGKILSGGVEAGALQKPKRFFGSARNIEGGGSLTILGTALVETGSKMDEVIFEEFKGTGNMELHLDRELVNKRIFPALNFEKSGTRKEELLYHPHEMEKIYGLRRAMKGVPSTEAMEMLISRIKKTKTNAEFLMAMGR